MQTRDRLNNCCKKFHKGYPQTLTVKQKFVKESIVKLDQANGLADEVEQKPSEKNFSMNQSRVACDGGGGSLGHPRIWLTFGPDAIVTCPYCSRKFIRTSD